MECAEECFTWEVKVAGNIVGTVPVRWRGCGRGCLDFLQPDDTKEEEAKEDDMTNDSKGVVEVTFADGALIDFD